jgi:hypothetical protein
VTLQHQSAVRSAHLARGRSPSLSHGASIGTYGSLWTGRCGRQTRRISAHDPVRGALVPYWFSSFAAARPADAIDIELLQGTHAQDHDRRDRGGTRYGRDAAAESHRALRT